MASHPAAKTVISASSSALTTISAQPQQAASVAPHDPDRGDAAGSGSLPPAGTFLGTTT
jgi:hypothetical protein